MVQHMVQCIRTKKGTKEWIRNKLGGQYLKILSRKDLYKETIIISMKENDTFSSDEIFFANFPTVFINSPLGEMRTTDMKWTNWNKAPLRLWQTRLNLAVFCASSVCGVSSEHLNYKKHSMVSSLYRCHCPEKPF